MTLEGAQKDRKNRYNQMLLDAVTGINERMIFFKRFCTTPQKTVDLFFMEGDYR